MSEGGWIGVDLDGTLAHYEEWKGHLHIGAPIPLMVERVRLWLRDGYEVRVFTARVCESKPQDVADGVCPIVNVIRAWCLEHIGDELPVTNIKDYAMLELWDDRVVQVRPNTGEPVGESTRGLR